VQTLRTTLRTTIRHSAQVHPNGSRCEKRLRVRAKETLSGPLPLHVHVIGHPDRDAGCRPLAESIYFAFHRNADQPLIPGIGIPVSFRHAGRLPMMVLLWERGYRPVSPWRGERRTNLTGPARIRPELSTG
jgi:hypothetical protein